MYDAWTECDHTFDRADIDAYWEDEEQKLTDDQMERATYRYRKYMDNNDTMAEIRWDCAKDAVWEILWEDGVELG